MAERKGAADAVSEEVPVLLEPEFTQLPLRGGSDTSSLLSIVRASQVVSRPKMTRFHPEALAKKFFPHRYQQQQRQGKRQRCSSDSQLLSITKYCENSGPLGIHSNGSTSRSAPPAAVATAAAAAAATATAATAPAAAENQATSGHSREEFSAWREGFCQLCAPSITEQRERRSRRSQRLRATRQRRLSKGSLTESDDEQQAPSRHLPCSCPDRRLHVACLETKFREEAAYPSGCLLHQHRRLYLKCSVCGDVFGVMRHRSRKSCDSGARISFIRHLLTVLVLAGLLTGFGLWSMFHPSGGGVNIVNAILIGSGSGITLLFIGYEIWLLHKRYDFKFSKISDSRLTQHQLLSASPNPLLR